MYKRCPESCLFLDHSAPQVCEKTCWHKDDREVKPFEAMVFGKLVMVLAMNGDRYWLEDGSLVHKSQVKRK